MIDYRLSAPTPANHLIHVRMHIAHPAPDGQRLVLPAWIPGSYMIRDYARHVVSIEAHSDGQPVPLLAIDKSTWQADAVAGALQVDYRVYAFDTSVRGAHLDDTHWYFNGACLFLCADGFADTEHRVTIERPPVAVAAAWSVATSMPAVTVDAQGFGEYRSADYAELIDHPVEMAVQQRLDFEIAGVPHQFHLREAGNFDGDRLARDTARVCAEHHRLLGTPADLNRYVFLAAASAGGYGGLEHRHSTSLAISRSALPLADDGPPGDAYRKLLGLISHEYFHLWNVKRLKPAVFTPYHLASEGYTRLLWVFEGITSYYDDLALVRSGVIDIESYLELLAQQITRVIRIPGRHLQSLADSSFYAWTKLYQRNENADNATISYYTKGSLVALALDLTLRAHGDSQTLDSLMRLAWQRYVVEQQGMPEDGFERLVADHCEHDCAEFFARYVHGCQDPDFPALFAALGIGYHLREAVGDNDPGGKPAASDRPQVWLGLATRKQAGSVTVRSVKNDGPAVAAGAVRRRRAGRARWLPAHTLVVAGVAGAPPAGGLGTAQLLPCRPAARNHAGTGPPATGSLLPDPRRRRPAGARAPRRVVAPGAVTPWHRRLVLAGLVVSAAATALPARADWPDLPEALSNNAVAAVHSGAGVTLLSFAGIGGALRAPDVHARAYLLAPGSARWESIPDVPGPGRLAATAVGVEGGALLFGGYSVDLDGAEDSLADVFFFDVAERRYQRLASMPVPVDDSLALYDGERYVYLIGGWHHNGNVNLVQLYDVYEDRWLQATPWPGAAVFGHAGARVGRQLIVCDGVAIDYQVRPRRFVASDACYLASIDADDPQRLHWQALPPRPGGPCYRSAAGVSPRTGAVVFFGGADNPYNYNPVGYDKRPSRPCTKAVRFDPEQRSWSEPVDVPGASMDHRAAVEIQGQLVVIGGLDAQGLPLRRVRSVAPP